jgi:hypothetical protein
MPELPISKHVLRKERVFLGKQTPETPFNVCLLYAYLGAPCALDSGALESG